MTVRSANRFTIGITVAVGVVIAAVVAVTVWVNTSAASGEYNGATPQSARVDSATGAIAIGDGADTVATYLDFMCPHCARFDQAYGTTLHELASTDRITLAVHPVAILDGNSAGTMYSTRSANALYCVAEDNHDAVAPFVQQLFANQPQAGSAGLADADLIGIASTAGARNVQSCIENQDYAKYVAWLTKNAFPADPDTGRRATPTVTINGEFTSLTEVGSDPSYFLNRFGQ